MRNLKPFITLGEVQSFVDPIARALASSDISTAQAQACLERAQWEERSEVDDAIVERLDYWMNVFREAGDEQSAKRLEFLQEALSPAS